MPRPIKARIDLAALRHNYLVAKQRIAEQPAKAWAVVKSRRLLATACCALREPLPMSSMASRCSIWKQRWRCATPVSCQPILLLEGFFDGGPTSAACGEYALIPGVHRIEQLQMIRAAALAQPLPIYLKLNTGMNRLGFTLPQLPAVLRELAPVAGDRRALTLMAHLRRGRRWARRCLADGDVQRDARAVAGGNAGFAGQFGGDSASPANGA